MSEKRFSNGARRLRSTLLQIAGAEGRLIEDTHDLQAFVSELSERGIITREGSHFRIRWGIAPADA